MSYPTNPNSLARPYRIWDAKAKVAVRWRYYGDDKRAHLGALCEMRWAKVGTCLEVYDIRDGRLLGQYKRLLYTIRIVEA